MPSIQSCELSRLDLKGVSLVSIVAGSWPFVCLTADVGRFVCKTNQNNNRRFVSFELWSLRMLCVFEEIWKEFIFEIVATRDLKEFLHVFVYPCFEFDVHDLRKSGPYRWQWAQERWRSCHSSTCFTSQCMSSVMKSFGQVCHLLSSKCVCVFC